MAFGEWETYDHPVACERSPDEAVPANAVLQSNLDMQL